MHGDVSRETEHASQVEPSERAAIEAFVDELGPAVSVDSNVALHPRQLHAVLVDHVTLLAGGMRGAGGTRSPYELGHDMGEALIAANLTGPVALPAVLERLRLRLPELASTDHPERLATITGGLAAGYVYAVRERLLDEQESIKRSALLANEAAERSRRRSEARFRAVFTGSGIGIGLGDVAGNVVDANPSMCEIFGLDREQLLGRSVLEFIHPTDKRRITDLYENLVGGERDYFSDEFQLMNTDGQPVWTHVTMSMMPESEDGERYAIATLENVSELQLLRAQYNRTIEHDSLTGLPNTRRLQQRMDDLLDEAEPGEQVALCFFDIDGFKVLNDGLGREIGDRMLLSMATTLRTVFSGNGNMVARVAGDGFAALVRDPASPSAVIKQVEEVQEVVGQPHYVGKTQDGVALSLSVGIAVHETVTIQPSELVRAAEITLHRAKAKGKAQWMLNDPGLNSADRRQFRLGAVMPGALETGEFSVVFEPVRRLEDGALFSYLAALRWQRKDAGLLTEPEFLPLAEETGMITGLEQWAINEVCRHIAHWREAITSTVPLVGVGVSARTARDQELIGMVRRSLRETRLEPTALALHVPIGELAQDSDAAESIARLGELGMLIGADGFGGGPNLFDLGELPVRVLRLVPEATARITEPAIAEGVRAFTTMAHGVGRLIAAPGVTDEAQHRALLEAGVDLACGPAIGSLVTAAQLAATLA